MRGRISKRSANGKHHRWSNHVIFLTHHVAEWHRRASCRTRQIGLRGARPRLHHRRQAVVHGRGLRRAVRAAARARLAGAATASGSLVLGVLSPVNNVHRHRDHPGRLQVHLRDRGAARARSFRAALKLQAMLGGGTALAFFARRAAHRLVRARPTLTPYLRLAAGVVLAYSFYAVFVGAANGRKEFHKQAGLDMTYSTLRCVFVVGAASRFRTRRSLPSAASSPPRRSCSSSSVLVVGFGRPSTQPFDPTHAGALLRRASPLYLLIVNLLMFTDGLLLKRVVTEWAQRARRRGSDARTPTRRRASTAPCRTSRASRISSSSPSRCVIFPLISKSTFDNDLEKTRGYVRNTMRYSLVAAAPVRRRCWRRARRR